MVTASKPSRLGYINMLVFGDPGSGKTVFAGSADAYSETGRALFIDAESGTTSLYEFYPDIDVVQISSIQDFQDIYEFLRKHLKLAAIYEGRMAHKKIDKKDAKRRLIKLQAELYDVPEEKIKEPRIYNTVIMDTFTEMQKYVMADITGTDADNLNLKEELSMPTLNDWGRNSETVRLIARTFRNLDMHTIITCHAQNSKDDKTGATEVLPDLPGKLARQIMGFVDIVGYIYATENEEEDNDAFKNVLITRSQGKYVAKDRFDKLGSHMEMPTVEKIIKKIKGDD